MSIFRSYPEPAGSQKPLAQNNPYSKEADFGVAYSVILQFLQAK